MQPQQVKKKSNKWPIIMMVWPAALLLMSFLLYALVNFIFGVNEEQPSQGNIAQVILNIVLFLVGVVSILLGPISFIIGLVLLLINLSKK